MPTNSAPAFEVSNRAGGPLKEKKEPQKRSEKKNVSEKRKGRVDVKMSTRHSSNERLKKGGEGIMNNSKEHKPF